MISRYSRKELVQIWSEENKYRIRLDVEIAAAEAMEKYKIIPKGVAKIVKKKGQIFHRRKFLIWVVYGVTAIISPQNQPLVSNSATIVNVVSI